MPYMCYALHMLDMARDPAVWRQKLTPSEAKELELAERTKRAAVEQYNAVFQRLKNRCIQRVRAEAARDEGDPLKKPRGQWGKK